MEKNISLCVWTHRYIFFFLSVFIYFIFVQDVSHSPKRGSFAFVSDKMDKFVSQSKEWMSKSSIDYNLEVNENEQRLTFRADENVSFYINYADKEDGKLVGLSQGFHNHLIN